MVDKKGLLVVGSLNYDLIIEQSRLAKRGETFTVDQITMGGGGKGANQAVQAAKLGAKTLMIGSVGQDIYGEHLLTQLKNYGVNTDLIQRSTEPTGLGVNNVLPDGTVYGNIFKGANYSLTIEDLACKQGEFEKAQIVLFQMEIPMEVTEYGIRLAKEHGCYVILNAAPAMDISKEVLGLVDCLIVNENEASFYLNKVIQTPDDAKRYGWELKKRIADLLIITLGEDGSLLYSNDSAYYIPVRTVKAVDATGAGDSYVATFAVKLLEGLKPAEAVVWATLASSITVTKAGSQVAMPTLAELEKLNMENKIRPTSF